MLEILTATIRAATERQLTKCLECGMDPRLAYETLVKELWALARGIDLPRRARRSGGSRSGAGPAAGARRLSRRWRRLTTLRSSAPRTAPPPAS